jgi:3-carboxy-cis,cis-muconate cycloisomerase
LLDAAQALPALRQSSLWVSLSGAAGTSSALGPQAAKTRAALASGLGLHDPERTWHTDRTPLLRIADWQGQVIAALGHIGQSLIALSATDVAEVSLGAAGASSTMPQKQNPVGPSALLALSHQFGGLRSTLQTAAVHTHQRDGAAWFTEWMVLPQLCLTLASALQHAKALCVGITPRPVQMHDSLQASLGLIHAEALSFALADRMPRPDAQKLVKALCGEAMTKRTPLKDLVAADHPDLAADIFDPAQALGDAPAQAHAFAARAAAL